MNEIAVAEVKCCGEPPVAAPDMDDETAANPRGRPDVVCKRPRVINVVVFIERRSEKPYNVRW